MDKLAADNCHNSIPSLGLLALALTIITYAFNRAGLIQPPVTSLGTVLLLGGGLQILAGVRTKPAGNATASATLLPLGLFWLSLIGFEIFPSLGFGKHPSPVAMVAYLSMWGFFAALLFLASFRQSRALQLVFSTLMICLMLLALGTLKENPVLMLCGSLSGIISGLAAGYTSMAQLYNRWTGRSILPLGNWQTAHDDKVDEPLAP